MMDILDTLDKYNGVFMLLVTIVYAVTTFFICRANQKSAAASLKQVEQARAEFDEASRAFVTVNLEVIKDGLIVLKIQNIGKRVATNVKVCINEDFILNLGDNLGKECLQKLSKADFILGVGQIKHVFICSHLGMKQAGKKKLIINHSYKDRSKVYSEVTNIDMEQYFWELIYNSPIDDMRKEMKGINDSLKYIKDDINKIRQKAYAQEMHKVESKEKEGLQKDDRTS